MAPPNKKDPKPSSSSKISSKIGESWIEILHGKDPSPKSRKLQPVAVGEDVTLVISTKVMRKLPKFKKKNPKFLILYKYQGAMTQESSTVPQTMVPDSDQLTAIALNKSWTLLVVLWTRVLSQIFGGVVSQSSPGIG